MGLFGSSKSSVSTSTQNITQVENNYADDRVAAADSGIAVGRGATLNYSVIDGGAFDFADKAGQRAADLVGDSVSRAYDFAKYSNSQALGFADAVRGDLVNAAGQLIQFTDNSRRTEASRLTDALINAALPIAIVAVIAWAFVAKGR